MTRRDREFLRLCAAGLIGAAGIYVAYWIAWLALGGTP